MGNCWEYCIRLVGSLALIAVDGLDGRVDGRIGGENGAIVEHRRVGNLLLDHGVDGTIVLLNCERSQSNVTVEESSDNVTREESISGDRELDVIEEERLSLTDESMATDFRESD